MAIIPEPYLNAVASIGRKNENKDVSWIGTGFFVYRKKVINGEEYFRPFLITNKHVCENIDSIVIRMIEINTNKLQEIEIPIFPSTDSKGFKLHDNPQIDIAVIPINADLIRNKHKFYAFDIDENAMTSQELLEKGVNAGSLVYMLGYPMGLVNKDDNVPICRLGCVARICESQINASYNILLDIQNFPGNSGSPIVTRPDLVSVGSTPALNKCILMGIIHSYIPYQENLINTQTKRIVEIRSENSGLANMHPVEYIREIIDKIEPLNM